MLGAAFSFPFERDRLHGRGTLKQPHASTHLHCNERKTSTRLAIATRRSIDASIVFCISFSLSCKGVNRFLLRRIIFFTDI